jgi:protein CpxP
MTKRRRFTPIIADRQDKMKALASESGRRRKKAREIRSIMSESDNKMGAVLNDEQKNKYEEMQQERWEHAKERRPQRDNGSQ